MRALFISKNLIGDGLGTSQALRVWHDRNPDWEIDIHTLPDVAQNIYRHMGVPIRELYTTETVDESSYDFVHRFDVGKAFELADQHQLHMTEAYAWLLFGEKTPVPRKPFYDPPYVEHQKDRILLSMHSKSCASWDGKPPNKMLPWSLWWPVLILLRQYGQLAVLGGPKDKPPLPLTEDELCLGTSLEETAWMMRSAKLLVTLDNGMAHIGAARGVPMIEFYPACNSLAWAAPLDHDKLHVIHVDPARVNWASVLYSVRKGIEHLLIKKEGGDESKATEEAAVEEAAVEKGQERAEGSFVEGSSRGVHGSPGDGSGHETDLL